MTWLTVRRTLEDFIRLRDDWDGLGAQAPTLLTIETAMRLLVDLVEETKLPAPSRVGACPMGGILFEWQGWGRYLEAEITPAGAIAWMEERKDQPTRHGIGTPDGKIEWSKETR